MQSVDFWGYLRGHVPEAVFRYADLTQQMRYAKVLAMFFLGLWAGRHAIAGAPERHLPLLRTLRNRGFAIGLPFAAFGTWAQFSGPPAQEFLHSIGYGGWEFPP